ncbi:MAG: hypothetical protein QGI06_06225 [Rhodospirillales bacterium]|jgi:flagellar motility protein MotE (MotC chaperone)|nr:hypothetical protein [Rhodospirillales bacterium]
MFKKMPSFRYLPVTIFVAALVLTVKIGDIWEGFDGILKGSISVSEARAQQEKPPAADATEKAEEEAQDEDDSSDSVLLNSDPTLLTQAEIDLLQQLAERREKLESRDKELGMRAGLLDAAETRINAKIEDLRRLQATIEGLIKTYDDQQSTKMQSLVKIYQNMKPKDAARIFEELDMDTLLSVAELMNERKLAPIMAKMDPSRAKDVTVQLSRLRELPKPGVQEGG